MQKGVGGVRGGCRKGWKEEGVDVGNGRGGCRN